MNGVRSEEWGRRWFPSTCWLGFAFFDAAETVLSMQHQGMHHDWPRLFLSRLLSWLPWALATKRIISLEERFPVFQWRSSWVLSIHLLCYVTITVAFTSWATLLDQVLDPYASMRRKSLPGFTWLDLLYGSAFPSLVLYVCVLLIAYVIKTQVSLRDQQLASARLSQELSLAQLTALRSQIEPHFLFNSLNASVALIREGDREEAADMITELSEFLRQVLQESTQQEVRLEDELSFVNRYMRIQKVRFADRLRFSEQISPDLLNARIPSLLLQPIVENAIKHGIARSKSGGEVQIVGSDDGGMLQITVRNDGPSVAAHPRVGIGLSNVRNRLATLYGDRFQLDLRSRPSGGAEVILSLPLVRVHQGEGTS